MKSAAPIPTRSGISFFLNPPVVRKRANKNKATIKVEKRIVVIVIIALLAEPLAMNAIAVPNPKAAITARTIGLTAKPPFNSGPLANTAPVSAILIPSNWVELGFSPFINAIVNGIKTLNALIGATTPIRPVARPV